MSNSYTPTAGVAGKTVLVGSGAPDNGLGSNGDSYYDKDAKVIYTPKAAGAWPVGVSLVGAAGTGNTLQVFVVAPAASAADAVATGWASSDANTYPGSITQPGVPRALSFTFPGGWDGGNPTIHGTNQYDAVITETLVAVAGTKVSGVKCFKTVTSITKPTVGADAGTGTCGTLDALGLVDARIVAGATLKTKGLAFRSANSFAGFVTIDSTNHTAGGEFFGPNGSDMCFLVDVLS